MLNFLRGRQDAGPDVYDKRLADYNFSASITHGFPTQPTCLDIDPILNLLAIGSRLGCIRIYGAPGVEMIGATEDEVVINRVKWLPGRGAIAAVLEDWSLQIFHIIPLKTGTKGETGLALRCTFKPETRVELTAIEYYPRLNLILCGTDQGDIFCLSADTCERNNTELDLALNHATIASCLSDEYNNLRAVEEIHVRGNQIAIAYARGVAVIFNLDSKEVQKIFYSRNNLQIEALDWFDKTQVYIGFNDGATLVWNLDESECSSEYANIYGSLCERNEKCKPIQRLNKLKDIKIIHGGLPRSSYGDRYSITVCSSTTTVAFDFSSKIIDYRLSATKNGDAESLIVLCEEELVAIDLISPNWPVLRSPYLASPHSSALTGCNMSQVSKTILEKIKNLCKGDDKKYSSRPWPINGGKKLSQQPVDQEDALCPVILTGHEDGAVRIWDLCDNNFQLIAKIETAHYFITDDEGEPEEEEEWPPFRKVGEFDPYSDDPRLGIRKMEICPTSGAVLIGGTAGQVIIVHLVSDSNDNKPLYKTIDVVKDQSSVVWKGHPALQSKDAHRYEPKGYQAHCIGQMMPPAAITSVAIESSWGLVGIGTSHGYALFDYRIMNVVVAKCTLQNADPAQEGGLSRFSNMKQSLRQSMRRIRSSIRVRNRGSIRSSGRRPMSLQRNGKSKKIDEANRRLEAEMKQEREIVMRNTQIPSAETSRTAAIVRVTYFATTYTKDGHGISPSFFIGTAGGCVAMYGLNVPDYSKRSERAVELVNGKELQLSHRAPVINITVMDSKGAVGTSSPSKANYHYLMVTTEEQVKVFSLPKLLSKKKFKLTALEGSLMLRAKSCRFRNHSALITVTNQGEIIIFNPNDRTVVLEKRFECIDKVNKYGLVYAQIDPCGFGLYPLSMSEFQRYSVSASYSASFLCSIKPVKYSPEDEKSSP